MNFKLTVNLGKSNWDEPDRIFVYHFSSETWEEAEVIASNALTMNEEDFNNCINQEYDVNWCVNAELTEMSEVTWQLNELSSWPNDGREKVKLTGTLELISETRIIDVTKNYYRQSEELRAAHDRFAYLNELKKARG